MNFVFRFHITSKNACELRFSFFVFASLTLKNGFEFCFCMACYLKNRSEFRLSFEVPAHPLGVDRGINFLCKGKQLNFLLPWAKVSGELPGPRDMSHTHGTPFLTRDDK